MREKKFTNYDGESYDVFGMTDEGIRWIRSHANDFIFGKKLSAHSQPDYADASITDDDIPF